jgi:hypothetical protein
MTYETYKILHVFAVLLLFLSLGTVAAGGRLKRLAGVAHGVALVIILVAGFGLLARLALFAAIPAWAWLKIVLWLLLAIAVVPLRRRPEWATRLWLVLPFLGGLAAWLAIRKPF